jgi:hypothetical protein
MSANKKGPFPPGFEHYHQNRRNFPQDELAKYAGQYVAFSGDGTRILAGGDTMEAVEETLVAAGIDPSQVVGSYIDEPDISFLGGGAFLSDPPPEENE